MATSHSAFSTDSEIVTAEDSHRDDQPDEDPRYERRSREEHPGRVCEYRDHVAGTYKERGSSRVASRGSAR